jgi:hypothetical protein
MSTFYTLIFRASLSPMARLSAARTLATSRPNSKTRLRVSGRAQSPFSRAFEIFARHLAPKASSQIARCAYNPVHRRIGAIGAIGVSQQARKPRRTLT